MEPLVKALSYGITGGQAILPANRTFIHNSNKPYLHLLPSHKWSLLFEWQ